MKQPSGILLGFLISVVLLLSAAACTGESNPFVGTWHLKVDMTTMPSMTESEEASAKEFVSKLSFDLTINGDGTATATGSMMQTGDTPAPARWTAEGNRLILENPNTALSDKQMIFTLKDGKLWFDPETMGKGTAKYFYLEK